MRATDPALFELKSASLSVLSLLLKTSDVPALASAMAAQFGETPEAFSHDPVVIDLAQLADDLLVIDFGELAAALRRHRLLPVAVRGGTEAQMAAALAAGLGEAVDGAPPPRSKKASAKAAPASAPLPVAPNGPPEPPNPPATQAAPAAALELTSLTSPTSPPPAVEPVALPQAVATITIDKPLRSGQQVYAKGGDLIVLAAVNFGAEVLADGNIHVYGPLRGKAVAGAKGNVNARIFSTSMEPELVAIAGTYRTTENPLPADVVGKPAQIRLEGDRLVFEPLA